jgi:hypothetical protein
MESIASSAEVNIKPHNVKESSNFKSSFARSLSINDDYNEVDLKGVEFSVIQEETFECDNGFNNKSDEDKEKHLWTMTKKQVRSCNPIFPYFVVFVLFHFLFFGATLINKYPTSDLNLIISNNCNFLFLSRVITKHVKCFNYLSTILFEVTFNLNNN